MGNAKKNSVEKQFSQTPISLVNAPEFIKNNSCQSLFHKGYRAISHENNKESCNPNGSIESASPS